MLSGTAPKEELVEERKVKKFEIGVDFQVFMVIEFDFKGLFHIRPPPHHRWLRTNVSHFFRNGTPFYIGFLGYDADSDVWNRPSRAIRWASKPSTRKIPFAQQQ